MLAETMSSTAWPSLTAQPPTATGENNSGWEMIAEEDEPPVGNRVVILPSTDNSGTCPSGEIAQGVRRRERSATICGLQVSTTKEQSNESSVSSGSVLRSPRRHIRRCASTPDLVVSDNAHEIIVEDESDSSSEEEDEEEVVNVSALEEESFEVVTEGEEIEEQVMTDSDEESGTFVSAPSEGTSSWTMATSPSAGAWGGSNMTKKTPSFADMLKINISSGVGEWGTNKEETEARLKDAQNKHHIRVRTKPKIVVTEMKHALSTGDLTKMAEMEEERERELGRNRRPRKQLSAMMEDEEDLTIGRGDGGGGGTIGGNCGDVMGDTDAMDFYHRKEAGSKSTQNKKKERPDEAKRKEISMHKKDMQRKKQAEKGGSKGGGGAKKKKTQQFGGKKERRRL